MNYLIRHRITDKVIPSAIINSNPNPFLFPIVNQLFKICNCQTAVLIVGERIHIITTRNINGTAQLLRSINEPVFQQNLLLTNTFFAYPVTSPTADCANRQTILFAVPLNLIHMEQKFLRAVIYIQFHKRKSFFFCFNKILFLNP